MEIFTISNYQSDIVYIVGSLSTAVIAKYLLDWVNDRGFWFYLRDTVFDFFFFYKGFFLRSIH